MPTLSAAAKDTVQGILDKVTAKDSGTGIPGLVFCAIDKSGNFLTKNASGLRSSVAGAPPMTLDTVL